MRICIDIDGTICETRKPRQAYSDVKLIKGAAEVLSDLKDAGHYIILYTARHMKTCNHNVGQVIAKQGKTLLNWLDENKIPYDEVHFGKPLADIYIDDKACKFKENWNEIFKEINKNV